MQPKNFPSVYSHRLANDTLHGAREGGCHAEAAVIQDVHGNLKAPAHFSQYTLGWHADIIKVHLCCVGRLNSHLLLRRTTENKRGVDEKINRLRKVKAL